MSYINEALEQQLKDLEAMVAQSTQSERHARAVISALRDSIHSHTERVYDEGYNDGWNAEWQQKQLGRRV